MKNVGRVGTLAACVACLVYACVIYPTGLLLPADLLLPDAGGPDVDTCDHAYPPERDDAAVPNPTENTLTLTFATSDVRYDRSPDLHPNSGLGPVVGYDLDGVCACDGKVSCAGAKGDNCTERGRNSSYSDLAEYFGASFEEEPWSKFGQATSIFIVDKYNGTPNDPNVGLRYYASLGYRYREFREAGVSPTPKTDGNDEWTVEPGSTLLGDGGLGVACISDAGFNLCPALPGNQDANAFVRDGVLVSRPVGPVRFMVALGVDREVFIQVMDPVVTVKLEKSDAGLWLMREGTIAGRQTSTSYLQSVVQAPDFLVVSNARKPAICENPLRFSQLRDILCNSRDMPARKEDDGKGAAVPCDSVSLSASFQAVQAKLGIVYQPRRDDTCPVGFDAGTCP